MPKGMTTSTPSELRSTYHAALAGGPSARTRGRRRAEHGHVVAAVAVVVAGLGDVAEQAEATERWVPSLLDRMSQDRRAPTPSRRSPTVAVEVTRGGRSAGWPSGTTRSPSRD